MLSRSSNAAFPCRTTVLVTLITTTLAGCATVNSAGDAVGRTTMGCIGGSLLGAGIGALLDGEKGALRGAAIGLAAGCVAGYAWDEHEKELRRLAQEENMRIQIEHVYAQQEQQKALEAAATAKTQQQSVGMVAQVADEAMFDVGSANLTAVGQRQLEKLAVIFSQGRTKNGNQKAPLLVIGHTDSTGTAEFNQQLSEERAKKVVQILAKKGIPSESLYYQGAGEGRPVASNDTDSGRAANRRVELVELQDDAVLAKRIAAEEQNPRYIQHGVNRDTAATAATGTSALQKATAKSSSASTTQSKAAASKSRKSSAKSTGLQIDFGGKPDNGQWELSSSFKPDYSSGFGLISSAVANEAPLASCSQDAPRVIGQVKNLAGKTVVAHKTSDYLPGMNGKVWAAKVNGHVVYVNPVAVLKDDGQLAQQPQVAITKNYDKGQRNISGKYQTVATTYKGQDNILMRLFIDDKTAPVQCMDILLPYGGTQAQQGSLHYGKADSNYVVGYSPRNTSI
ncbi:OmpA family protein [Aeromonas sobria]|jgi:outer membrane protein OmpA-like peptidoglycan-associated protein|nr:OmpA family protein [Aeromonas sobria]